MIDASNLLYSGKAKSLYKTAEPGELLCVFRDDTSAFNGVKCAALANKGKVNNFFNAFIMQQCQQAGIQTHFIELVNETTTRVKALKMIPVECVIRNFAAGSLCKRLNVALGQALNPPIFEFFFKSDALGDPFINESHIISFNWATAAEIEQMKLLTQQVNAILVPLFLEAGMLLVDYKLEFGKINNMVVLGDEFSPDGCRIWDANTKKIMDKDRFRQDLGDVVETYLEVARRLNIPMAV
jgi:phosphoribosylaminoimidazole-succinocarboxamide synthase